MRFCLFAMVLFFLSSSVFAADDPAQIGEYVSDGRIKANENGNVSQAIDSINISRDYMYYDKEIGSNVISFTIDSNHDVHYLTKESANDLLKLVEVSESEIENENNTREVNYEYYRFSPRVTSRVVGSRIKATADFIAPAGGGAVTKTASATVTQSFSVNVSTSAEKSAIQAGCGFTWTKSASTSSSYTAYLQPGESGYLAFTPYLKKVVGTLGKYSIMNGLISSKEVTGYSVTTLSSGEADGVYQFIYY